MFKNATFLFSTIQKNKPAYLDIIICVIFNDYLLSRHGWKREKERQA
jgi:hypothetical protein